MCWTINILTVLILQSLLFSFSSSPVSLVFFFIFFILSSFPSHQFLLPSSPFPQLFSFPVLNRQHFTHLWAIIMTPKPPTRYYSDLPPLQSSHGQRLPTQFPRRSPVQPRRSCEGRWLSSLLCPHRSRDARDDVSRRPLPWTLYPHPRLLGIPGCRWWRLTCACCFMG